MPKASPFPICKNLASISVGAAHGAKKLKVLAENAPILSQSRHLGGRQSCTFQHGIEFRLF
jgi:hypothetical protein